MKKYKICVYAICKNEEKFVDRWMDSVKEADEVIVLDTGSNDETVKKLKARGATVYVQEFDPWRFDIARNKSLGLVPEDTDICVCIDLDEVIEPGWRNKLENIWLDGNNRLAYNYNWSFDSYGNPATNFYIEKIHDRKNYKWYHPVHEVLKYIGTEPEKKITTDKITVNHYPDLSKSRGQYFKLLELAVEEDPEDDRNMHYLGREYMYNEMWEKCIDTLIKHLNLKNATWKEERSASMRYISKAYKNLKRYDEAKMWLEKAILESPNSREPYVEYAFLEYNKQNWRAVKILLERALMITERGKTYINENFCWDSTIYDLLSIANFNLGEIELSLNNIELALDIDPLNLRLQENKKIFEEALK